MSYEPKVLSKQLPIVKWFIYHLIYYRVIWAAYNGRQMRNEFWTVTIDAHLLQATTIWCMVFGSDSNPTHWKRLSSTKSQLQKFRDGLLTELGLSGDQWHQYWNDMRYFRDNYAAHRKLDFATPVPNFDTALKVVFYYDRWVRELISPDTIAEPELKSFARSLQKSAAPLVKKLMEATAN